MRIFSVALLSMTALVGSAGYAGDTDSSGEGESLIDYVSFQPCSSWSYDGTTGGYKCNFTGVRVSVPEYRDVQRLADLVETLERKIADLEERVARLEND